jgi:hypothetical protein
LYLRFAGRSPGTVVGEVQVELGLKKPDAGWFGELISFALQRIQQTDVTWFERLDSGHPPGTQTNVLLASH